jgi:hypothetical protein
MSTSFAELSAPGVIFLRRDALARGFNDRAIAARCRSGDWHRLRHGAYIGGELWSELDGSGKYAALCRACVLQSKVKVVLSHLGAVNEWHAPLWDLPLDAVDLSRVDGKAGRNAAGVRQHRGHIAVGDVGTRNDMLVMSATRSCLELTTLTDVEHSVVVMDDLLNRKLTTKQALEQRNAAMSHWPDTLTTDLVIRLADGRSESVGETRTRHLCWTQHLPAPVPQFEVRDRHGTVVARVDLAWPELGVFLEFDGKQKYLRFRREGESVTDAVLREKAREDLVRELTGWRCIRIIWADLNRPAATATRIRAMFRSAAA